MGVRNREKKIYAELCRLLWVVLAPSAGYMTSAKRGGGKRCGGLAMIARLSSSFSNRHYTSTPRRILLPAAAQTAIKRMTIILVMQSSLILLPFPSLMASADSDIFIPSDKPIVSPYPANKRHANCLLYSYNRKLGLVVCLIIYGPLTHHPITFLITHIHITIWLSILTCISVVGID